MNENWQHKTTFINSGHVFQEEDSSLAEKEKVPLLLRPEISKSSEHKNITMTKCQDSRKVWNVDGLICFIPKNEQNLLVEHHLLIFCHNLEKFAQSKQLQPYCSLESSMYSFAVLLNLPEICLNILYIFGLNILNLTEISLEASKNIQGGF